MRLLTLITLLLALGACGLKGDLIISEPKPEPESSAEPSAESEAETGSEQSSQVSPPHSPQFDQVEPT